MPGAMFSVVVGKRKWYCDCVDVAARARRRLAVARERRRPHWSDLARERRMHLQRVRVRVDVDDLAEAGVRGRAVVALEEVLHHDLPVRLDRPLVVRVEANGVDVEPARGDDRRQVAERRCSGGASGSGFTNTNGPQVSTETGASERPGRVEPRLALGSRRPSKRAVEVVRPRVVRALQRFAAAGALDDEVAAMPADVHEASQHAVRAANDSDRARGRSAPRSTSLTSRPTRRGLRTSTNARRSARARVRGRPRRCTSSPGSVHPSSSGCSSVGIALVSV